MAVDPLHVVDLADGKFAGTSPEDLDQLFAALNQDADRDRLVVHFHGGLVGQASGTATAERLRPIYEAAGGYPVFFVWHAGLLETTALGVQDAIADAVRRVGEEKVFNRLRDLLLQLAMGKARSRDGDRAVSLELPAIRDVQRAAHEHTEGAGEPFAEDEAALRAGDQELTEAQEQLVLEQLRDDGPLSREVMAVAATGKTATTRGLEVAEPRATLMDAEILADVRGAEGEGDRGLISTAAVATRAVDALKEMLKRFARGRDHGLYPTVVEELLRAFYLAKAGELIWSSMKQNTVDSFGDDPQVYGGTAFLHRLRDAGRGDDARTILVGHSTGAVYICHLLRHADAILPPGMAFDVILLAPACTCDLLDETIREHGERIANLRVFTMTDALECADHLAPPVYTRSLLYFVSGVVEHDADTPIAGMQRFYADAGRFKAPDFAGAAGVRSYYDGAGGRVAWSESAGKADSWNTASHRHGDFDNDEATLKSVANVITHGF